MHQVLRPPAAVPRGYVNGVAAKGGWCLPAVVGWDEAGRFPADFAGQVRQTLVNTLRGSAACRRRTGTSFA